jgi:hypothetical protein
MARQIQGSQRDFSFGEVDIDLKRSDDHPARKGGLRQMSNARIHNSNAISNRSGRRALYPTLAGAIRTERFAIQSGVIYDIQFLPNRLRIINAAGVTVLDKTTQGNGAALPWVTAANIAQIVFTVLNLTVTITFGHAMRPQVLTFDGVTTWSISDYAEALSTGGQKRTTFYRLSPQNVTMLPSAITGAITVGFSSAIVVAGMVGTRVRYCGRQILLGSVIDSSHMNATVIESLPPGQSLAVTGGIGNFGIGDVLEGATSGAIGIVTASANSQLLIFAGLSTTQQNGDALTGGTSGATGVIAGITVSVSTSTIYITVTLTTSTAFVVGETITGPHGTFSPAAVSPVSLVVQLVANSAGNTNFFSASEVIASPSASGKTTGATTVAPQAVSVWDDEVMNGFRGYPASCFSDQFRLGFCDFQQLPGAICWSGINSQYDLYANDASSPDNAIFEIAPSKVRVYYVVPGPEGSEFVICDRRIYYIPISPTNPLRPGSVAFQLLSGDGAAQVQPRLAQEAILYVNAGQNTMMAVIATGAYYRPFNTKNLTDYHSHLFNAIQCIAAPSADGTFNERYAYVLNGDGSIAVGKYKPESLQGSEPVIGWGPWSGAGVVSWIAAQAADVVFTSSYFGAGVVEILDDTQYLDCALPVNNPPAAMVAPAGKGPLWFIPGQTVTLMDQITRMMGTYQIDGNGNIIPQGVGGENLAIASLVAGQPWTMITEPFAQDAAPGVDQHQRMLVRRISYFTAYVIHSTGFMFAKLFSSKQTATSPPLGSIVNTRRVPAWNLGDDATKPPPSRETAESWRPSGLSYDPRVAIIKDTPGPLFISEIAMEITL